MEAIMGIEDQITPEQFKIVCNGPFAAAAYATAGYRRSILDIGKAVVATKTGGFLGFGAKSVVDEQQQATLDKLAAMLEMSAG
jgi:hypothetical protein